MILQLVRIYCVIEVSACGRIHCVLVFMGSTIFSRERQGNFQQMILFVNRLYIRCTERITESIITRMGVLVHQCHLAKIIPCVGVGFTFGVCEIYIPLQG